MTLLWLPTRPMCKAVQGPTGFKRLERNYRRSQLYAMQRFYEELPLGMPRSASTPLSKPGRPRNRWSCETIRDSYDSSPQLKFRSGQVSERSVRLCIEQPCAAHQGKMGVTHRGR